MFPNTLRMWAQCCHARGSGTGAGSSHCSLAPLTQSLLPVFVATGESRDQPQPSQDTQTRIVRSNHSFQTDLELKSMFINGLSGNPCRFWTLNPSHSITSRQTLLGSWASSKQDEPFLSSNNNRPPMSHLAAPAIRQTGPRVWVFWWSVSHSQNTVSCPLLLYKCLWCLELMEIGQRMSDLIFRSDLV